MAANGRHAEVRRHRCIGRGYAVLGVHAGLRIRNNVMSPTTSFKIRLAERRELPLLPELERRAGRRFEQVADLVGMPDDLSPLDELEQACEAGRVWVAVAGGGPPHPGSLPRRQTGSAPGGTLAGFAYAAVIDDCCHLEEVSVLPQYGRLGIGTALVGAVREHAIRAGLRGVTLTTFRDVAWNVPFYRRLGFEVLNAEALTPGLAAAVADEVRRGLPSHLRVAMLLPLTSR